MVMASDEPSTSSRPSALSQGSRGISFDDRVLTNQRSSDASSVDDDYDGGYGNNTKRPSLVRRKTGDPKPRPMLPAKKPVIRSKSGGNPEAARRAMMNQRAMSTRDFGGARPGRGLSRSVGGGPGGRGPGSAMMAQRSMSTRLLGAASDFTRMASTRALFMEEPEEEPSIIMYMGREIKVEDHFDDAWIEDALDEEAGLKNHSNRMSNSSRRSSQDISRRSQNDSSDKEGSNRQEESDDDEEEESEVEEDMEEEEIDQDGSANDGSKRRGRRASTRRVPPKRRSQSVEPAPRPSRPAPFKRHVARSRTFDGRQTSEILPRRRKPKNRSARPLVRPKADLHKQFQEFLSKTGGVTPTGNHRYQNGQQFTVDGIRRRQPKMPTSRKKVEQFRKLEYTAEDIQGVLCEDDDTFQRLKRVLTKKGAITNGVLQQRLHIFLKKAKDRQSKLVQQRKEEEEAKGGDEETDNMTNLQVTQPDWAAMSMMDMFAHSVRKLTSDTTTAESPSAAATPAAEVEPKFQRRALPRMQAVMAKRNNMAAKKSSRTLMATFAEDEEEEDSSNHDNSEKKMENATPMKSQQPFRRKPPKAAPSPIARPRPRPPSKRDSGSDDDLDMDMKIIEPKELPVTSSKPMELDLSHKFKDSPPRARELPVTNDKPMELDLSQKFKDSPPRARELPVTSNKPLELDLTQDFKAALPVEPKCLDDELSASQRPMQLDLSQNFQDLPVQPKCLDDELSASQRPMQLDLKQQFQGELPIEPKCLDDSKNDDPPMKLDLSGSGNQPLLFTPKNMEDNADRDDADLLFQPKKMDDGSKMDGSRARRRHRPSRIRNFSGSSKGSSRSGGSSATPTKSRARRSKSLEEPPPLEIKCLDDPPPNTADSPRNSNGSAAKPAPPGLLVGWQH